MTLIEYAQIAAPIIFVVVGFAGAGWFKIQKETNALLREQNIELKEKNAKLESEKLQFIKDLASMQGQIDVLKSIPLVNIDTTLKNIEKFNRNLAETNKAILLTLRGSAETAAEAQADGGLLVKTKADNPLVVETKEHNPLDVKEVDQ